MADYPHLKLPYKMAGLAKSFGGGGKPPMQRTIENRANRQQHGTQLLDQLNNLRNTWEEFRRLKAQGESALPDEIAIPIFLRIDPNTFNDLNTFRHWGVQIISEEDDGFLLGVSQDGFQSFEQNLIQFLRERGTYKNTAANIWEIGDNNARIDKLLTGDLKEIWGSIEDKRIYTIEIGVYCDVLNLLEFPDRQNFEDEIAYEQALVQYRRDERELLVRRDSLQIQRENEISNYVEQYQAILYDEWDNGTDALYFKLSISGNGLRDLVIRYQYLFKVAFPGKYQIEELNLNSALNHSPQIFAPAQDAPVVCIIDSGIQEEHHLIAPAINGTESFSYVKNDSSPADKVKLTGHGTKVAGAVLYPRNLPTTGPVQLSIRLQNVRILDDQNKISDDEFGPSLIEKIVNRYSETRIFNLSVAEDRSYHGTHMHELAESIDNVIHEKDVLFVISAGNIFQSTRSAINPGIQEYIQNGIDYPAYLDEENCRIANPAISSFALTVGSVAENNYEDANVKAVAGENHLSPFSRTGLGMWGAIKPDVVEYGGDLTRNKLSHRIAPNINTCIELVNSTLYGAASHGKESFGTSYSAPKVSHIAAMLQKEHPEESSQMYRALIVQSARLPDHCFQNPTTKDFARYGYGIPDLARALNNTTNRITFIQQGKLGAKKADIYKVNIPSEFHGESSQFQLLVEVTLAFTARTRVTRKGAHSYLSTWLEWKSSKYNENFNSFRNRTLQYLDQGEQQEEDLEEGDAAIRWIVRENPKFNRNVNINRNNSTVQKSWALIHPHQFTDDFSISIIGHTGWDKNLENEIPYALTISFEAVGVELPVYELFSEAQIPGITAEVEI
jgi:hypothetical protein